MTAAQRRAINRHNARQSTGPITPEGKERARQNSLKHGMCAATLALPIEDADDLQNQFDEWVASYPAGRPRRVRDGRRDRRRAVPAPPLSPRWRTPVVELQVNTAYRTWSDAQDDRLHALQALLAVDPAAAVRQLRRLGSGRRYLIDRWKRLGRWFLRDGYCGTTALVEEAVRLLGADPKRLPAGPPVAYEFRLCCTGARPVRDETYLAWLLTDAAIHPEYHAEYGRSAPETDDCRDMVRKIVAAQIEALEQEEDDWRADEQAEAAGACLRAQVPCDGPDTKLTLRYEAQARGALHKALKALDVLQDARFAAESEAGDTPLEPLPSVARNEPETPQEPQPSAVPETSCDASTDTDTDVAKAVTGEESTVPSPSCGSCPAAAPSSPVTASRRLAHLSIYLAHFWNGAGCGSWKCRVRSAPARRAEVSPAQTPWVALCKAALALCNVNSALKSLQRARRSACRASPLCSRRRSSPSPGAGLALIQRDVGMDRAAPCSTPGSSSQTGHAPGTQGHRRAPAGLPASAPRTAAGARRPQARPTASVG